MANPENSGLLSPLPGVTTDVVGNSARQDRTPQAIAHESAPSVGVQSGHSLVNNCTLTEQLARRVCAVPPDQQHNGTPLFGCTAPESMAVADTIWLLGEDLASISQARKLALLDEAKDAVAWLLVDSFDPKEGQLIPALSGSRANTSNIRITTIQPKHHGEMALVKAVAKRLVELDDLALSAGRPRVLNTDFIAQHTLGFHEFARDLRNENWYILIEESGVDLDQIERLTRNIMASKNVVACWDFTHTQQQNGDAILQLLHNVMMMRGQIGLPVATHLNGRGNSDAKAASLEKLGGKLYFTVQSLDRNTPLHRARKIYGKRILSLIGRDRYRNPQDQPAHEHTDTCLESSREVLINLADVEMLGLTVGDLVDITSIREDAKTHRIKGFRLVPSDIPRGCISTRHMDAISLGPLDGKPESDESANVTPVLVHLSTGGPDA